MKTKAQKRAEAKARRTEYETLTLEEKLARAMMRGHPGSREVQRLQKQLKDQGITK